ncbi:MAG: MBOAT family protein [Verrucomicrobia bacterium]|nr:MBOAT family protein [Verrucomicrobiota bacterium]
MWCIAFALFFGFKWAVFMEWVTRRKKIRSYDAFRFFLLWPGMDIGEFLGAKGKAVRATLFEWLVAILKTVLGALLVWGLTPQIEDPFSRAWSGMVGLILMLHFGSFQLLSIVWRIFDVKAEPIMKSPLLSRTLSEFWSVRWNRAFNNLANAYFFKPIYRKMGLPCAVVFTFLMSGLIHDLVISIPAGGGYGLPTLYFAFQGLGIIAERSKPGKQLGISDGVGGIIFTWLILVAPVFLLFHTSFLYEVMNPFLDFLLL